MDGGAAWVNGYDMDASDGLAYLIYGAETRQYPRYELQVADGRRLAVRIVVLVLAIVREIEQRRSQTGLVESINDKLLLLDGESHISVLSLEGHSLLLSSWDVRLLRMPSWHNGISAFQVIASPFYGTCRNGSTIGGMKGDASAGTGRIDGCPNGEHCRQNE